MDSHLLLAQRDSTEQFFCLLSFLYDKYNFTPDNIYNVDETGI
jgi:hypothetical protein